MERSRVQLASDGAKDLFLEYCSNSSVHGVRYFGCRERSVCEKFWWVVVFVLSVGSCAMLIHKTYQKWDQTPVIVSFNEKSTPVWQIPFPAVTICPQTKVKSGMLNFSQDFNDFTNMDPEEQENFNRTDNLLAMMQLCERTTFYYMVLLSEVDSLPNKISNLSYASLVRNMSLPMYEMMEYCVIRSEVKFCRDIFTHTMTEEGICTSFNLLSAEELLRTESIQSTDPYLSGTHKASHWTLEKGYSSEASLNSYPYRTLGPGYSAGISLLLLSNNEDMDYLCRGPVQAFKALLHSPADYPQVSQKFVHVPMDQEVNIAVKPQMVTTTSGLRSYTSDRRQCFFNSERYLQFFQVYTQDNCELECLTNYTLQRCGCVKFSMLRSNETKVCETNRMKCLVEAENELLEMDVVKHHDQREHFRAECNCLPACTSMQYDAEITQTDFDWLKWIQALKVPLENTTGLHVARLGIYFKEAQFMTSKRSELYGLTDFLANCGGLLGLCMGVSLLSLVELCYFCTVRPFSLWRKQKQMSMDAKNLKYDDVPGISLLSMTVKRD
ncbi:pickpocket protein 28-like [Ochlerotatus camptorhynchus]|uniref:pickpocket protein 28-like n=1 Tax=Ochlerotatus camptorhynchus TaxID=644619 RepID=UPI0031D81208